MRLFRFGPRRPNINFYHIDFQLSNANFLGPYIYQSRLCGFGPRESAARDGSRAVGRRRRAPETRYGPA